MEVNKILQGDSLARLKELPDGSIDCVVTSPPYWGLRDYGVDGQLGLEATPEEYVAKIVEMFRECRRVLKKEGTLWLNLGDSYIGGGFEVSKDENYDMGKQATNRGTANFEDRKKLGAIKKKIIGLKHKDLVGIPWMTAFALRADGWYLRQDIIWHKPNPMPESVTDRCTKSHEYIFLMKKSPKYYFDNEAIQEPFTDERMGNPCGGGRYAKEAFAYAGPNAQSGLQKGKWNEDGSRMGRNKRSVWTVTTKGFEDAHFATFTEDLIAPMILAGCPANGIVLDPFMGAGTTGLVSRKLGRNYLGIELNPAYISMAEKRIASIGEPLFLTKSPEDSHIELSTPLPNGDLTSFTERLY